MFYYQEKQLDNVDISDPVFRFKMSEFTGANTFAKIIRQVPLNVTNSSFKRMGIPKFANLVGDESLIDAPPGIENIFGYEEESGRFPYGKS